MWYVGAAAAAEASRGTAAEAHGEAASKALGAVADALGGAVDEALVVVAGGMAAIWSMGWFCKSGRGTTGGRSPSKSERWSGTGRNGP